MNIVMKLQAIVPLVFAAYVAACAKGNGFFADFLWDKFVDERVALEKEEMNGKHAYDMLMQDLTAQIDQATQDRGEKSEIKTKKLQEDLGIPDNDA